MKSIVKGAVIKIMNAALLNRWAIRRFNTWYEAASNKLAFTIERRLKPPGFDYTWKINVGNKPVNFTYYKGERKEIFHFPLSYKINDQPLKAIEQLLHQHYSSDVVYFDIGANFGLRSLYYLVNGRSCYLFEPNEECNAITERLFKQNNFSNGRIVSRIIGPENKIVKFYISNSSYLSSVHKEHVMELQDLKMEIEMEQIAIDDFVKDKGLQGKVKIVKVDVEGLEYEVCLGASNLLGSDSMCLLLEILPSSRYRDKLFAFLKERNYTVYCIDTADKLQLIPCSTGIQSTNNSIDYICTNDPVLIKKLNAFQIHN